MEITGVVLAGGLGRRLDGQDKGFIQLADRPMVAWVLERIAPQVSELLINANRNLDVWKTWGYPVVQDDIDGFIGPLAGIYTAMRQAKYDLVMMVPCDAPFLPVDLGMRLFEALSQESADVAVAKAGGKMQPVFCLCRTALRGPLGYFLEKGGRRVQDWYKTLNAVEVEFEHTNNAFFNINTDIEREEAELCLKSACHKN